MAVTLCVRVWIEIAWLLVALAPDTVTLCVRVWIEIFKAAQNQMKGLSHPLREGVD